MNDFDILLLIFSGFSFYLGAKYSKDQVKNKTIMELLAYLDKRLPEKEFHKLLHLALQKYDLYPTNSQTFFLLQSLKNQRKD